jgi:ComF family protein
MIKLLTTPYCEICGRELKYSEMLSGVCEYCVNKIEFINLEDACKKCSLPNVKDDCPYCKSIPFSITRNVSLFRYDGTVKSLFFKLKFNNDKSKIKIFHKLIKNLNVSTLIGKNVDFIVPVPSSPITYFKRGFNIINSIFKPISKIWQIEFLDILGRKIFHRSQKKLSKSERQSEIKKQFFIRKEVDLSHKTILIVDDVFTTGSTVNTCSELIKSLGASEVYSLTLFRANLL